VTVPNVRNHLIQATANRDHAEWLLAARSGDPIALQWAVTAAFYSALHGVTAYLMSRGVRVSDHASRARALAHPASGVPLAVHDAYRLLERRSRQGRYMLRRFTWRQVRDLLDQELAVVATFVGM
jgi:hypothetical protein